MSTTTRSAQAAGSTGSTGGVGGLEGLEGTATAAGPAGPATAATDPPLVLAARGLTRTYHRGRSSFTAVKGIDLEVRSGEVFGLLGTNGAGKTSTLDVLEGLASPAAGSVTVFGLDPVKDRAAVRRRTGTMLQSGGLPRELTATETLTMWAGTCRRPRPVGEILEAVGLSGRAGVRAGSMSGGEQRRLDLACALIAGPDLLFLDEPTTGLDPESRRRVWDLLSALKADGVTMVLTTHYLEEAERLCDRIAIMHQGRIAREGSLAQLIATASAQIRFRLPSGSGLEPPGLPGSFVTRSEDLVSIATSHLQRDTRTILDWADRHGLELASFAAQPATLETVFLAVADHREN